jgi:hypothetical protein
VPHRLEALSRGDRQGRIVRIGQDFAASKRTTDPRSPFRLDVCERVLFSALRRLPWHETDIGTAT